MTALTDRPTPLDLARTLFVEMGYENAREYVQMRIAETAGTCNINFWIAVRDCLIARQNPTKVKKRVTPDIPASQVVFDPPILKSLPWNLKKAVNK